MKSSICFLAVLSWATLLSAQASSSTQSSGQSSQTAASSTASQSPAKAPTSQPSGTSATGLKVRGPEAVAQQDPKRVVAVINGNAITAEQALSMLKLVPENQRRSVPNIESLLQKLYMLKQFSADAVKMNLDQQSPWKEQLQFDRENILTQAYLTKLTETGTTAAQDPKQYYDAHPDEFDQAKVSGIVVAFNTPGTPAAAGMPTRTEQQARDKANDLEKKLKAGSDFAALARSDSDNQASAARGGELGTFSANGSPNIPAELKSAITKLQPGQTSDPIRLQNAYVILKVDSRAKEPFDQAKPQIIQKWHNEHAQEVVKQQFEKYKVEVKDPDFFNASNAAANTPSLQRTPPSGPAGTTKSQGPK